MLKSGMKPYSTSGIWTKDVAENPEWLVIYASQHQGEKGLIRDGFHVSDKKLDRRVIIECKYAGRRNGLYCGTDTGPHETAEY